MLLWWGPRFALLYNDAYIPFLGPAKHPRMLARPGQRCWGEIWDTIGPMLESVVATGRATWSEDFELYFARRLPLEEVFVTFSYAPIVSAEGDRVDGVFCPCFETTDRVVGARRLETLRRLSIGSEEARAVSAVSREAVDVMRDDPRDLPFAAIYVLDDAGTGATLESAVLPSGLHKLPQSVNAGNDSVWPLMPVLRSGQSAEVDLVSLGIEVTGVVWPDPVHTAFVLPIPAVDREQHAGLLVVGLGPRRVFDAEYRAFLDLVAGHIGTALADARAYEAERRRAEALAELDRAKTAFFANVSHEFRTPITLMLGPIEDALAEAAPSSPQVERLEMVRRNGLRLLKLVNNLLNFSRLHSGRAQATFAPTNLAAVTIDLASNFRSACDRAGISLVVDCPPLSEPVYVDRALWEDIVLNLLSNAIKFTLAGEIRVTLGAGEREVLLTVTDTGVGIAASYLDRVFERFQRATTGTGRTYEGTGIGLSLVQEAARIHGGDVTVESALGKGTTFCVHLPLGKAHLDVNSLVDAAGSPTLGINAESYIQEVLGWNVVGERSAPREEASEAARFRVLIADDNADMRTYVSGLLSPYAHVDAAPNGVEALQALEGGAYDLLLADVMMPLMDGFELLRKVRESRTLRLLPVVLLSARAGNEARVEGLEAGADDYLVKPFASRDLVARVVSALALSRARTEAALGEIERQVVERTIALGNAESERQEMRRRLVDAEEVERRRLSRELHDQLGQHLTAFVLGVADARRRLDKGEAAHARLSQLEELASLMTRDARYLALELRPPELDDVGLESALATYIDQWKLRYGIDVEFEVLGDSDHRATSFDVNTAVYRIAQEALTNVAKHANAHQVTVLLDRRGERLRLIVEDDGQGFEPEVTAQQAKREHRLGLAGMRERGTLVGGTLEVETSTGRGTTVYLDIPTS